MKKITSILLSACMCLSVGAMLVGCDHEHAYQTDWSKDATHHWHACEDCPVVADREEHAWDEGKITTPASAESDGTKTYTCTVCQATKEENVVFTPTGDNTGDNTPDGMTAEKWAIMISPETLTNYTVSYGGTVTQTDDNGDVTVSDQSFTVKFNEDKIHVQGTIRPEGSDTPITFSNLFTGDNYSNAKKSYEILFLSILADYENYQYDSADDTYTIPAPVNVTLDYGGTSLTISLNNSKVSISNDGKLLTLVCEYTQTEKGAYTATSAMTYTFTDYGTTVIPDTVE